MCLRNDSISYYDAHARRAVRGCGRTCRREVIPRRHGTFISRSHSTTALLVASPLHPCDVLCQPCVLPMLTYGNPGYVLSSSSRTRPLHDVLVLRDCQRCRGRPTMRTMYLSFKCISWRQSDLAYSTPSSLSYALWWKTLGRLPVLQELPPSLVRLTSSLVRPLHAAFLANAYRQAFCF